MSEQIKQFFENLQADFPELKYRPGNTYADVRCKPATIISIRVVRGDVRIAFINQGGKYSCPKKDFNDWINESGILRKENPCGGYFEFSEGKKSSDKTQVSYLYSLESENDLLKPEVQEKLKATYAFLKEGEGEMLTLLNLEAPNTLNVSLLSTNNIENVFKNLRRHIGRVSRWRKETNQADRWLASGLKLASKGFRKIMGYGDLPDLIKALEEELEKSEMESN